MGVKPFLFGAIGFFGLIGFYFGLLSIANSPAHALQQFFGMWYWIIALAFGFGTQIGLFFFIREKMKAIALGKGAIAGMGCSGGISGTAMAACCAHHLADLLPFIGLTGFAVFLNQYQTVFLSIGLASSVIGIVFMLFLIKKNKLL